MKKLRVLDLFSGIGGFSLGLEKTGGFETVLFCECDNKAQLVLKKNWPFVPCANDVSSLNFSGDIDVITGGFPCQDLSNAGKKGGLNAERSGLWWEMRKQISIRKPKWVIIENVSALLENQEWFTTFLQSLSEIRYDAIWNVIRASDIGAIHERKRVWIIAYPMQNRWVSPCKIQSFINGEVRKKRQTRQAYIQTSGKWHENVRTFRDHRKDDGISEAVDRVGQLGNSVHVDIVEIIGKAILHHG